MLSDVFSWHGHVQICVCVHLSVCMYICTVYVYGVHTFTHIYALVCTCACVCVRPGLQLMCTCVAHVLWLSLGQSLVIIFSPVGHRWPHLVRKHGSRSNVLPMNWTSSLPLQHLPVYSSILCFLLVSLINNITEGISLRAECEFVFHRA